MPVSMAIELPFSKNTENYKLKKKTLKVKQTSTSENPEPGALLVL